jgi:predicted DCC family thiol-disulfide oxidoreductase YuxK
VNTANADHDGLLVLYDADCGICTRTARLLRRLDRRGALDLMPAQAADHIDGVPSLSERLRALQVRDARGRWLSAGAAGVRIAGAVPVLRPLAVLAGLPVLRRLVEPAYALVADNRHRISRWIGATTCEVVRDRS